MDIQPRYFHVVSDIYTDDYIDRSIQREYENYQIGINTSVESYRIFADCEKVFNYEDNVNINGENYYNNSIIERPHYLNWDLIDDTLVYSNIDNSHDIILSSLDLTFRRFFTEYDIMFNGHILLLKNYESEYKVIYYNIANNNLKYHRNMSINYSNFFNDISLIASGDLSNNKLVSILRNTLIEEEYDPLESYLTGNILETLCLFRDTYQDPRIIELY